MFNWKIKCLAQGIMPFIWSAETEPTTCPKCGSDNIEVTLIEE